MKAPFRFVPLAIIVLVQAAAPLFADPREKQQALQKWARDAIQSSHVDADQQQEYEQNSEPDWDWRTRNSPTGVSFSVPQVKADDRALWYKLGDCQIGDLDYDFDQILGADSSGPLAGPIPAAPANQATNSQSPGDANNANDQPPMPDLFDYPRKAQFFVELVREYGPRPARRKGARPIKLDDAALKQIEQIVRDEIKSIEAAQRLTGKSPPDPPQFGIAEVTDLLMDYDARIHRLVLSQFDAQADARGLLLRQDRSAAKSGGAEPVQVVFQFPVGLAEPNRVLAMCGGNFDYLKGTWKISPETDLSDSRWRGVHWKKTDNQLVGDLSPGRQAIVAVWDNGGSLKFAKAHKYPDNFKAGEAVTFDTPQSVDPHK